MSNQPSQTKLKVLIALNMLFFLFNVMIIILATPSGLTYLALCLHIYAIVFCAGKLENKNEDK